MSALREEQLEEQREDDWNGEKHSSHHSHHHSSSHHRSGRKHRRKRKKNKALQLTIIIVACIAILVMMAAITYKIIERMGAANLAKQATTETPVMTLESDKLTPEEEEQISELQEGQILYNGQIYQYNSDIRTFAILGIDHQGTIEDLLKEKTGGQSDMIFLAMLNPHTKKIQMIAINRATMTDIWRYDVNGEYVDTVTEQITLQHAYGTGAEDSCERTVAAIDNLMYMVPIHGYFSMNMGAISKLNDAIGGVELTALESINHGKTNIKEGEKVTLLGQDAFWYTKYRDVKVMHSADGRLSRQKQYLAAFINKLKTMVKNDMSIPLNLFNIVSEYSVTNVSIDEMTHLVTMGLGYSFSADDIYSVPGETVKGEVYDEFYVDEEALYDMIVELFYEPVNR